MATANDYATFVLSHAGPMTHEKLQGILWVASCEFYLKTGKPLFDENFIKGERCPVVPSVAEKCGDMDNLIVLVHAIDTVAVAELTFTFLIK